MAKIFLYTGLMASLMALISIAGIPTATGAILNLFVFFNPSGFLSAPLYVQLIAIITAAAVGAAIVATFFGRQPSESYILTPLISILGIAFLGDMAGMIVYTQGAFTGDFSFVATLTKVIIFPLAAAYTIALVQFWRGNDI